MIQVHKNIWWADAAAKRATELDEPPTLIPFKSAIACIKAAIKDTIHHQRTTQYKRYTQKVSKNRENKSENLSRPDITCSD